MKRLNESQVLEWKYTIERWQKSYLSMYAWCRENQISVDKMNYWRAKLNLYHDRSIKNAVLEAYPDAPQIFLHAETLDLHTSLDYLKRVVDESFCDASKGDLFVFLGIRRHTLRIFHSDAIFNSILSMQLNRGTFLFDNRIHSLPKHGDFYILK